MTKGHLALIAAAVSLLVSAGSAVAQEIELDSASIAAQAPIFTDLDRYLPAEMTPHTLVVLPSGDSRVLPQSHWYWNPDQWHDWQSKLRRPDTFQSLSMSFVGLTVVDTIMTAQALHDGSGRELNPMLSPFAQNTAALVATKAAVDVAVIYLARKIRRTDERSATNVLIFANAITGVAVIRNMAAGDPQIQR